VDRSASGSNLCAATEADVLDAYPRLTHDDIQAALRYAADAVAHEVIVLPRAV
jgi:uncharacterized protein (DUF433 family)